MNRRTFLRAWVKALAIVLLPLVGSFGAFNRCQAREPAGPSSRRTPIAFTEIHYHPLDRIDGSNAEFVELYNSDLTAVDLGGFRITGDIQFAFPPNTVIEAGEYLIVAKTPEVYSGGAAAARILGPHEGALPNDTGVVQLRHRAGGVLLDVEYSDCTPWPSEADGAGHSLVLANPSFGESDPRAWSASDRMGGSPGEFDETGPNPLAGIVINEILARTDSPDVDFIELYNRGAESVDLSGAMLADHPTEDRYVFPDGTMMSPGSFLALEEEQLGFALDAAGETIFLFDANRSHVVDAVRYEGQSLGVSSGLTPDGAGPFQALAQPTPGVSNARRFQHDVVINEIMFHPVSDDQDDEYVELYNQGESSYDLSGWRFVAGIEFAFPDNLILNPGEHLVVARNAARLRERYPQLNESNTLGDFTGALSDAGERVALARFEAPAVSDSGPEFHEVLVDEVHYVDGGRWSRWADGGGSSLELTDPSADNRLAANWADSDETGKSEWTLIERTGVLDLGRGVANALQALAQGAGEYLIDDVQVLNENGDNLISNGSFESGTDGWLFQGSHDQSSLEEEGFDGSPSLRIRAVTRGDTGPSRIWTGLGGTLRSGDTATLRARVRWLRGHPEILLRLYGNYLEAFGALNIPTELGTPGLPNSRAVANAGPAIQDVAHSPILPAPSEDALVTTRIRDPDGVGSVELLYRVDPSPDIRRVLMSDDGLNGDQRAGDGVFSARIPGQAPGALAAYHIEARDRAQSSAVSLFPGGAPARECLIRFGEQQPAGEMGTYRLWMTQETFARWRDRNKMDNTPLDITFVYGDSRVVYNIGALYAGSPHISPGYTHPAGRLCGYVLVFPRDQRFLGAREVVLDWPDRDDSKVQEQSVYWMAGEIGLPTLHRRFIHLHVNGVTEMQRGGVYEDAQQVNSDYIESWYPDGGGGELYKIEQWFEFDANVNRTELVPPTLEKFISEPNGGAYKRERYRWNWLKRAVQNSANDYENIFNLAEAVNIQTGRAYTQQVEALADIEQWMRVFALEHIIGNFDSYGHQIGKNMYAYKPPGGRWQMHMWDIDWLMNASASRVTPTSPLFESEDPVIGRMYAHPPFLRAYYRAVKDVVEGPLQSLRVNDYLDSKNAALRQNGINAGSTSPGKSWLLQRRNYLVQQLASVDAPFAVTSHPLSGFELTGANLLELQGTAPIEVEAIQVNGTTYPIAWTSVNSWRLDIPLSSGRNELNLTGTAPNGEPVSEAQAKLSVDYNGSAALPEGAVGINEIMYHAPAPGADYIELFNRSAFQTFDMSGWRLSGVDFQFPSGSIIRPLEFLMIVENRSAFARTFELSAAIAGEFAGLLDNGGETLRLEAVVDSTGGGLVIDEVTYDDEAPWPAAADGQGPSLQLIDPAQDHNRVANWTAIDLAPTNAPPFQSQTLVELTRDWKFDQSGQTPGADWKEPGFDDSSWPSGLALLYVENSGLPAPKNTPLNLGQSAYYFRTRFPFDGDPAAVSLQLTTVIDDGAVFYLNGEEIHRLGMSFGPVEHGTFASRTVGEANIEGPFSLPGDALVQGENVLAAEAHQTNAGSSDIVFGLALETGPVEQNTASDPRYTPGAPNTLAAALPPFPELRLNEIQPDNHTGLADRFGERDPWVEIFNAGDGAVSLENFHLSDDYGQLERWAFPSGAVIPPGGFRLVWLDGQPEQTGEGEWHAGFTVPADAGSVVLSQPVDSQVRIVDYINYAGVPGDRSLGSIPDGRPGGRAIFDSPSPLTGNRSLSGGAVVFINEWMAANQDWIADPADGDFEDWLELYNSSDAPADIGGFYLTDDPNNSFKARLPIGTVIPAKGYLLVWADEETEQTPADLSVIHVNFRLNREGETILLSDPNGNPVDLVLLDAQPDDASDGRLPDGSPAPFARMSEPTPGASNRNPSQPVLRIQSIELEEGSIILRWSSQVGRQYQVLAAENLASAEWSVVAEQTAVADFMAVSIPFDSYQGRYFRIMQGAQ